jgi:hypothetical protein
MLAARNNTTARERLTAGVRDAQINVTIAAQREIRSARSEAWRAFGKAFRSLSADHEWL